MSDTDIEGLRDTLPPPSVAELITELQASLAESNALMLQVQSAAAHSSNQCLTLMQALQVEKTERHALTRRVERLERHLGLAAE